MAAASCAESRCVVSTGSGGWARSLDSSGLGQIWGPNEVDYFSWGILPKKEAFILVQIFKMDQSVEFDSFAKNLWEIPINVS